MLILTRGFIRLRNTVALVAFVALTISLPVPAQAELDEPSPVNIGGTNFPTLYFSDSGWGTMWGLTGSSTNGFTLFDYSAHTSPFSVAKGASNNSLHVGLNGGVGIGTASPAATLHVQSPYPQGTIRLDGTAGFFSTESWVIESDVGIDVPGGGFAIKCLNSNTIPLAIHAGAPNNSLVVSSTGNVGLGVASPKYPLQLAGGAYCTGKVWANVCSRELKENIQLLTTEDARDAVQKLQPVRHHYKGEPEEEYVSFIAEDVPDLVANRDRKSLSAMDIAAVLTKVVQDQDRQLTEERAKNVAQQQMLDALSRRLADLEQKTNQTSAQ